MTTEIQIPKTKEEAVVVLNGLAVMLEWDRAATVAAYVRVGQKPGPKPNDRRKSDDLTPRQFADLGVHGLTHWGTVLMYAQVWLFHHDGQRPERGSKIALPAMPWSKAVKAFLESKKGGEEPEPEEKPLPLTPRRVREVVRAIRTNPEAVMDGGPITQAIEEAESRVAVEEEPEEGKPKKKTTKRKKKSWRDLPLPSRLIGAEVAMSLTDDDEKTLRATAAEDTEQAVDVMIEMLHSLIGNAERWLRVLEDERSQRWEDDDRQTG